MDANRNEKYANQSVKEEHEDHSVSETSRQGRTSGWLVLSLVVLLAATAVGSGYIYMQHQAMSQLENKDQALNDTVSQMHTQVDALNAKLVEMSKPPAPPPAAVNAMPGAAAQPGAKRSRAKRPVEDKRWKQVQSQLEEQQKQLKQTQDDVAQTRTDLEGRLGSTRDELNGSIARTHDELVELEKRGERSFFEFDLSKSKQFQRTGPIQLSLRKADPKHKNYDLVLLVDDDQLTKKKVNLYEPVWIHNGDNAQPLQVVVNRIDKNHVRGYVSAPKYVASRLSGKPAPGPELPTVAGKTGAPPKDDQPPR